MQQIYRRWLSRYRWANVLKAYFLQTYLRYWSLKSAANIPYVMLESVAQLAANNEPAATKIMRVDDATVIGCSRFILKDKQAAYDASYPDRQIKEVYADYLFQEESHLLTIFEPKKGRCLFPYMVTSAKLDGAWLSVMSASSDNWMHWLSESVPRFVTALDSMKDLKFGLLVDQQMSDNMRNVLDIFAKELPRFVVPTHLAVEVPQLLVPSGHTGMSAFWARPPGAGNGIFYFDVSGLRQARDTILEHFGCQPRKARKLFILRKSFFRHITNQGRVEMLLRSHGFETISPGEMSVEEQVKAFSEAAVVVAQAGAALANIMFMPEESTVICLSVRNEHVNYDYFRDYAKTFNITLTYVLGKLDNSRRYDEAHIGKTTHPMNAEFSCPEIELVEQLKKIRWA